MNMAQPVQVSDDEWAAYLRLQVAREMESGVSVEEDRFYRACGSFERAMRVLSTINRLKADAAVRPSVLDTHDPDLFFSRPAPAVRLSQRSSGARRAGRTAATARHDRWQIGTLTLVTVTVCLFLLLETLRGVQ